MIGRLVIIVILLPILAFSVFGFLASFEPPGSMAWRVTYVVIGVGCIAATTWALLTLPGAKGNHLKSE